MLKVSVIGVKDLTTKLDRMTPKLAAEMRLAMRTSGELVAGKAQDNVVVDMGELKASIKPQFGGNQYGNWVNVVATAPHAAYVELGVGPLGAATNDGQAPDGYSYHTGDAKMPPLEVIADWCERQGIPREAAWPIAKKIQREGLPARSYLYKAYRETFGEVTNILLGTGKRSVSK